MPTIRRLAIALVAAAVLAPCAALAEDVPRTPEDVLEQALRSLEAQSKNARIKMRNGTREFAAGPGSAPAVPNDLSRGGRVGTDGRPEAEPRAGKPSWCCGRNVEKMTADLRAVEAVIVEYGRRLQGNEDAGPHLATMYAWWKEMGDALTAFRSTDSIAFAEDALGDVNTGIGSIRDAHAALTECCLSEPRANQQARSSAQ